MNERIKSLIVICLCFAIFCTITGCRSVAVVGDESLVESRILVAVNAERNKWTESLSQQLRDGLRAVDSRIDAVEGGLQQVVIAAREYRQFVLQIIRGLQPAKSDGAKTQEVFVGGDYPRARFPDSEDSQHNNNDQNRDVFIEAVN